MSLTLPLRLKGAPGSPYTRKMLAVLRYRHLPYEFLIGDQATALGLPEPKVGLLPTFYLQDAEGAIEPAVDSTPLIRRFDVEFSGRAVVPVDPVLAFLDYLIEDYADEWLTKAMFHYRWHFAADIDRAGTILPMWRNISAAPEQLTRSKAFIADRQIARLYVVGSNDVTAPVIEASYRRFLAIFDRLLQHQPFVAGQRPGAADFGLYAQLTQLAKFDPTPMAICLDAAPRVYAWTDLVDDLSGLQAADDGWLSRADARARLAELLTEIGRVYVPALLANASALSRGDTQMSTEIDGKAWTQPVFPYQAKCLLWIREAFARLNGGDQADVRAILADTGCAPLLES